MNKNSFSRMSFYLLLLISVILILYDLNSECIILYICIAIKSLIFNKNVDGSVKATWSSLHGQVHSSNPIHVLVNISPEEISGGPCPILLSRKLQNDEILRLLSSAQIEKCISRKLFHRKFEERKYDTSSCTLLHDYFCLQSYFSMTRVH